MATSKSDKTRVAWRWLAAIVIHALVLWLMIVIGGIISGNISSGDFSTNYDFGASFSAWHEVIDGYITNVMFISVGISLFLFLVWNILFAIPGIKEDAPRKFKYLFWIALLVFIVLETLLFFFFINMVGFPLAIALKFAVVYISLVPFIVSLLFFSPFVIKNAVKCF
jgi:hypothetical protein